MLICFLIHESIGRQVEAVAERKHGSVAKLEELRRGRLDARLSRRGAEKRRQQENEDEEGGEQVEGGGWLRGEAEGGSNWPGQAAAAGADSSRGGGSGGGGGGGGGAGRPLSVLQRQVRSRLEREYCPSTAGEGGGGGGRQTGVQIAAGAGRGRSFEQPGGPSAEEGEGVEVEYI